MHDDNLQDDKPDTYATLAFNGQIPLMGVSWSRAEILDDAARDAVSPIAVISDPRRAGNLQTSPGDRRVPHLADTTVSS